MALRSTPPHRPAPWSLRCYGTLHHDLRFYPETQTFFALTKCDHVPQREVRDRVLEVDLAGRVVWEWRPAVDSPLPCARWALPRNAHDCHHINSLQYHPATDVLVLSMRRLNGFLALRKATKEVLWAYTATPALRKGLGPLALALCPDPAAPWPEYPRCESNGFHCLQETAPNRFWVFFNCDSSGRSFRVDHARRCLMPLEYFDVRVLERGGMGTVYPLPWGLLLGFHPRHLAVWERGGGTTNASQPMLWQQVNSIWNDPVFLAPFVEAVPVPGGVRVRAAHHLWVSGAVTGTLRCNATPAEALPCDRVHALVLGPWMAVAELELPLRRNVSCVELLVSVNVDSGAMTTVSSTFQY